MPVAESAVAPPGSIPNPVVTHGSAGEYCRGDAVGGEAAAGAPQDPTSPETPPRGGAVAARWAHNPKVGGSNPPPATNQTRKDHYPRIVVSVFNAHDTPMRHNYDPYDKQC